MLVNRTTTTTTNKNSNNNLACSAHLVACSSVAATFGSNMLGICVCLCALLTHVHSLEPEEPISYTVSARFRQMKACNPKTIHPDNYFLTFTVY